MIPEIGAAFQVPAHAGFDRGGLKHFGVRRCAGRERVLHQLSQRAAEPVVRGDIEPDLFSRQNLLGQLSAHQRLIENVQAVVRMVHEFRLETAHG